MFLAKKDLNKNTKYNIWFKLLPFFILYLVISISFIPNNFIGDEGRYIMFAKNLLHGFYSPPYPNINLWNGPGYPLLISIILSLKLPLVFIRILNAVFLYLSLVITYNSIKSYTNRKTAYFFTVLLGSYFPIYQMLPLILTECFTWFLISLFTFLSIKTIQRPKLSFKMLLMTSFVLMFLALTKVIFGYVILMFLFSSLILSIFKLSLQSISKRFFYISLFSMLLSLPYLSYTYNLTGKIFFWSNSGGMSLYTMSSPYENELGDWHNIGVLKKSKNHAEFIDSISNLKPLERDEAFKNKAVENIKKYPTKYIKNWIANIGRLFFSYPYSDARQTIKTYFTLLPNMFVIVFIIIAVTLSIIRFKELPKELFYLLLFYIIYLGGSSLLSAYRRMFYITMPFWTLFISYIFSCILDIKLKNSKNAL